MKDIKKVVREGYAKIAKKGSSCCGSACISSAEEISRGVGYSTSEIQAVPEGANLGLGCGNPVALASLKEGEVVLDLGSGGGFDAFLASQRVGSNGRVIGVDMTPEMLKRARGNARKGHFLNVEFRLGEIENLPVEDNSVDVIISNCVINLSPDKKQVFKEAYRVLKPSGRMMVSDIVLAHPLPEKIRQSVEAYVGCLAGAMLESQYIQTIKEAGFKTVEILQKDYYPIQLMDKPDLEDIQKTVMSLKIKAVKVASK